MIMNGRTYPRITGHVGWNPFHNEKVFLSAGGNVHANKEMAVSRSIVDFNLTHLDQSDADALNNLFIARSSAISFVLELDDDATQREVHFWLGNRGLRLKRFRASLFQVKLTLLQVSNVAAVPQG